MIGMAQSCKGGIALANYVMQDEKGYELLRNGLCGETPSEILNEMKVIQNLNQRAEKKTLSLVISPEKKEGQRLSDKELREITKDFMNKIGINPDKQQFIAFVHTEKAHKHIHIIANRVKEDGRLINDSHIGKRAQWAGHNVAKERGLTSAKEVMIDKIQNIERENDLDRTIKGVILKKHSSVMKMHPKSMEEYQKMMLDLGVEVVPTINKQGQIQGHRMIDLATGKNFKASEVHRQLGLKNIMKEGIPFKNNDVKLTHGLIKTQNLALDLSMKIVKKLAKEIIREAGIGL